MAGNENLENIIAKIRGGQPEAFDELYRLTRNNVYYHAHSILANEEDALDAVQETYLVAFQRLGTLQNPSLAAAWLSGIATNVCLNKLRSDRHLSGLSLDDENAGIEPPAGEQDMPEAVIDQEAVAQIIAGMIDTLPALQRITILLFYYDELSVTAIAQLMDCPEATVRSRLSYARKSLELRIRSEEKRGVKLYSISPAAIALAFKSHAAQTLMPEAAASKIGLSLASGCGYRLTAAAHTAGASAGITAGISKTTAIVLACTIGAAALTAAGALYYSKRAKAAEPAVTAVVEEKDPAALSSGQDPAALSSEQASAYYGILNGIAEKARICPAGSQEFGLAYADLIDFDGDGNQELYFFYADDKNEDGESTTEADVQGNATLGLHECIYKWTDSHAEAVSRREHYTGGSASSAGSGGTILYTENGKTYLGSFAQKMDGGFLLNTLSISELRDRKLEEHIGVSESYIMANSVDNYASDFGGEAGSARLLTAYGYPSSIPEEAMTDGGKWEDFLFYDGQIVRDGQAQAFNFDNCRATATFDDSGATYRTSYPDSGETPVSLRETSQKKFGASGNQVITCENAGELEWKTNDVQALLDKLRSLGGISGSPSTDAAAAGQRRLNAYVRFAQKLSRQSVPATEKSGDHLALYDCNGDGQDELLAVYIEEDPSSKYNNESYNIFAEIYTADSAGQLVKLYSSSQMDAGGPGLSFCELNYGGATRFAYRYSNYSAGKFGEYDLLTPQNGTFSLWHKLEWFYPDDYDAVTGVSSPKQYTLDGNAMDGGTFEAAAATEKHLCGYNWKSGEDDTLQGDLTLDEFLAKYHSS